MVNRLLLKIEEEEEEESDKKQDRTCNMFGLGF